MGNGRIFDNVSAFGAGNSKCRTCFNKKVRYKGCKAFNRCLQEKCFGKNKCNPENPESCTVSIKKFAQNIVKVFGQLGVLSSDAQERANKVIDAISKGITGIIELMHENKLQLLFHARVLVLCTKSMR